MPETLQILVGEGEGQVAPAALDAWAQAQPAGTPVRLWLAGALTQELRAPTELRRAGHEAWQDYARRLAGHYGMDARGALAFWEAEGGELDACLAPDALDNALLQRLAQRLSLRGVHPLWLGALALGQAKSPPDGPLWLVEGRLLTRLVLRGGRLAALHKQWLAQADEAERREATGNAPCVGEGLDAAGWATALAALPALEAPRFQPSEGARRPRLGWALAATSALVLGVAGLDAAAAHREWRAAQELALSPAAPATARPAPTKKPAAARGASPEQVQQAMQALLQHPWAPLLSGLDAAAPPNGRWLRLEHRAGEPAVLLEGEADDLGDVLALVQQFAALPALSDAQLLRSQPQADGRLRFELRLRLREGRA
jgi:hypothetical protein